MVAVFVVAAILLFLWSLVTGSDGAAGGIGLAAIAASAKGALPTLQRQLGPIPFFVCRAAAYGFCFASVDSSPCLSSDRRPDT